MDQDKMKGSTPHFTILDEITPTDEYEMISSIIDTGKVTAQIGDNAVTLDFTGDTQAAIDAGEILDTIDAGDPTPFSLEFADDAEIKQLGEPVRCICTRRQYGPMPGFTGVVPGVNNPLGRQTNAFCPIHTEAAFRMHREATSIGRIILPNGERLDHKHFEKLYGVKL